MSAEVQTLDLSRIGCSDVATLLGMSRYDEPVDLWRRLVHGEDVERSAYVREAGDWGKRLEHAIAEGGRDKLGLTGPLFRPPSIRSSSRAWQRYSLDYVFGVVDVPAPRGALHQTQSPRIFELKLRNRGSLDAQDWGRDGTSDVAEDVLLQVTAQLEAVRADRDTWTGTDVPDIDSVDVFALVDGQHLRHYPVPYDAELGEIIRERCERFWADHVLTQSPPPLEWREGTSRELRRRYPHLGGELAVVPPEANKLALEALELRERRKTIEAAESVIQRRLEAIASGHAKMRGNGWSWAQWEQRGGLRWGALLERLGLSAEEFEQLKMDFAAPPRRESRVTAAKGKTR